MTCVWCTYCTLSWHLLGYPSNDHKLTILVQILGAITHDWMRLCA